MEQSKIRSWWARRQGLEGAFAGKSASEVLLAFCRKRASSYKTLSEKKIGDV